MMIRLTSKRATETTSLTQVISKYQSFSYIPNIIADIPFSNRNITYEPITTTNNTERLFLAMSLLRRESCAFYGSLA